MTAVLTAMLIIDLIRRVYRAAYEENAFSRAAALAYFFLLALFPLLMLLLSVFSFLPGLQEALLDSLARVMPRDAMRLINSWIRDVVSGRSGNLLSFFMLLTLWSASYGMVAMIDALNTAYHVKESRSYLKTRVLALGLTMASLIFLVGGHVVIVFGDWLALWFASSLGIEEAFAWLWKWVDYAIGLLLLIIGVDLIYYLAPDVERPWRLITPGSVFAVLSSVLASLLFSTYLSFVPGHGVIYGGLAAFFVLMLWLYLLGLALFLGGIINYELEQAKERAREQAGGQAEKRVEIDEESAAGQRV